MDKSLEFDLKSKIFYYFREKFYNLMLSYCKEGITKFKGEVSFHLYHSLALMLINRLEEGIHDLESIRSENDVKLAVTIALMYGNKLLGVSNKELYVKLDNQMREYRKHSEAIDFYHSAFVLVALNKVEKALDYVDKALNMESSMAEPQTLKGWILLQLRHRGVTIKTTTNARELFESSLIGNPKNLDTMIGLSECYLYQSDFSEAMNVINKTIVRFTSNTLPLLQKMKIVFAAQDYEQTSETVNRIMNSDPQNSECRIMAIVILLIKDANYQEAADGIKSFCAQLELAEPNNCQIFLETSQLFSRLCGRNPEVLLETKNMLEAALKFNTDNADIVVELGYQSLLSGNVKEALRYFKSASKINETSLNALLGVSLCELAENGNTHQLKNQIQYLLDLKDAQDSALLNLIQAKTSKTTHDALTHLKNISNIQTSRIKSIPYSTNFLLMLDPDFMLDVVKEFLKHSTTIESKTSRSNPNLEEVYDILLKVVKACPALTEALFLLAKLQYRKGDTGSAVETLEKILNKPNNSMSEVHLLMAQIQVQKGMYDRATQSLEVGVSTNFRVRENPIYHYITGIIDKHLTNYGDAVKALTTALTLVGVQTKDSDVSLVEKASIYVELIDTLSIIGQTDEATKVLNDATEELKGTPEEARILLLSADHALNRKNIQGAIDLLNRIQPTASCYYEAKTKHADILLKYRKDKFAFLDCYKELIKDNPGSDSYVLLGDAYMKVLEPDDALECYEKALKENPQDSYLTSKMGQALVDTHYFARAVNYYIETIKLTNDSELKLQLADLYMHLKQYQKAEQVLVEAVESEGNKSTEDLTYLRYKSRILNLLAQIQEKSGNTMNAMKTLKEAMDNLIRVKKRVALESTGSPQVEINMIADIAIKLGELSIHLKNNEKAINYFKEGLDVSPNNTTILVALAKLYMQMNYLELCQQTCSSILRLEPDNETASVMMADIAFRKVDFDMALFHFTQLVNKQPTNWEALVRLIEILRRTGNIQDAPDFLNNAETFCENPLKETGFLFCKALYQWYSGNLNSALKNFNNTRQDQEYGQTAIYNMIEICLNPDDEMLAEQLIDSDDIEYRDSRSMALKTADRLLKELKVRLEASGDEILRYKLLSNFRLLATKDKYNIEKALDEFVSIASQNAYKDHVGPTLGIATAYTLLKQGQRAKNQLKRIVKSTWTFEDAEYLERCWLLLADYYIQSTKFDIATDLINKVVQHNKACVKAYEYLGFISEKEQRYKEAANYYESAWKFGNKSNPTIGFKLAYSLMKSKKYPDAIEMAQEVLKINPDYPRVKKDILDKAMNNLRI